MRLLFETDRSFGSEPVELDGWRFGTIDALGLTWAEGHPAPGALARPDEVLRAGTHVRELVHDHVGVRRDRGVSRLDVTTTRRTSTESEARALLAGLAALDLPRCDTVRRGRPAQSIAWVNSRGRRILARAYDKGRELGGESWESVRLEDQRRFASGARPPLDVAADGQYQRELFERRFRPMASAAEGVRAATFPVVCQAIADEAKYGFRPATEARALAGSLVLLAGGAGESIARATRYRWRAELREAGFVYVDDEREAVDVDLGGELHAALEEFGA